MGKEIRKETDWLGREKDVIYESGKKVGETRHETTIFGTPKDVTYDTHGNKVSETRHETTIFGTSKEVTYDTKGNKISETRYEKNIFGQNIGKIRESREEIGVLKTEKGIFGGRKQVLHEKPGKDVDLTRRVNREEKSYKVEGGYFDYGDRSYTTSDSSTSHLETKSMPALMKWILGLGIVGILSIGLRSYVSNPQKKLEVEVAKKYNLDEKSLVRKSLDFSWIWSSKSIESYRKDIALYRLKNNKKALTQKLEENLMRLAKLMESKKKAIRFNDYFQFENDIWVAGNSIYRYKDNIHFGFICYSPDKGGTWFNQWKNRGCTDDFPTEIYFFDKNNGWSITTRRILHTFNGGKNWETVHVFRDGKLRQFHILNRNILVAQEEVIISKADRIRQGINGRPFEVPQIFMMLPEVRNQKKTPYKRTVYTSDGGRTWQTIEDWSPELFNLDNLSHLKLDGSTPGYISSTQKQMMKREPEVYIYSENKLKI